MQQWFVFAFSPSPTFDRSRKAPFKGLTDDRAQVLLERDGLNNLTLTRPTPEIVRLAKNMFGGFAMLLWVGSFLCFVAHFLEYYTTEEHQYDNVFNENMFTKQMIDGLSFSSISG